MLKHVEAKKILGISSASGSSGTEGMPAVAGQEAPGQGGVSSGSSQGSVASTGSSVSGKVSLIYDLLSERGRVLLGDKPNSIIVMDYPKNVGMIEQYLNVVDQGMSISVFKLKYIKADEVAGKTASQAQTEAVNATAEQAP